MELGLIAFTIGLLVINAIIDTVKIAILEKKVEQLEDDNYTTEYRFLI